MQQTKEINKGAVKFFEEKLKYEIDPYSVRHIIDSKDGSYLIIDVRDENSYKAGHVPGAKQSVELSSGIGALQENRCNYATERRII